MTRKDYELIARAFQRSTPAAMVPDDLPLIRQGWAIAAHTLADELTADNPRFDRDRFLVACGVEGGA